VIVDVLRSWLSLRFPEYEPTGHIEGTYGIVLILEAKEATRGNVYPLKFCVKTWNPAKLKPTGHDLGGLFEREMRLWLSIPFHYHVLPALGLELSPPPEELANQFEVLPLVRMPFCDFSLSACVKGDMAMPTSDRLMILAQTCSGLEWLYLNGLQEGHGDLKPDNILLKDLRSVFELEEKGYPSKLHPWQAKVADLGWADIWCQGGGTYHAWRPYLAPERFNNEVVREASDVFALGVIACELFSGVHPGGDYTETLARKWNAKRWEKWATSGDRSVQITPPKLRDIILRCLTPDPRERPTLTDLKTAACDLLKEIYDLEVALQLSMQDEEARKLMSPLHDSWVGEEISPVSLEQLDISVSQMEKSLAAIPKPLCSENFGKWLIICRSLQRLLLRRCNQQDLDAVGHLAKLVIDLILGRGRQLDLREEVYGKELVAHMDPDDVSLEFAMEALYNLKQTANIGEAELQHLEARLQGLYPRAWPRKASTSDALT